MRILLVILLTVQLSFIQAQSKDEARKKIWEMLETSHPDAHYFITELYNMPTKFKWGSMTMTSSKQEDFMTWVDDYSDLGLLSAISTVVHESSHGYSSSRVYPALAEKNVPPSFDDRYTVYFIRKNEEYIVKHTPSFFTKQIASEIPTSLRSMRYKTYISTNTRLLSAQQYGVYGLMNEWVAYYNGMKTIVEGFETYLQLAGDDPGELRHFISDGASIRVAYGEFKYFILHYLDYASRKEKKIYKAIMANQDFKQTFWAIDKAFSETLDLYDKRLEEIIDLVKTTGLSYELDEEGFFYIGNRGTGTYEPEYKNFMQAINAEKYQKILNVLKS